MTTARMNHFFHFCRNEVAGTVISGVTGVEAFVVTSGGDIAASDSTGAVTESLWGTDSLFAVVGATTDAVSSGLTAVETFGVTSGGVTAACGTSVTVTVTVTGAVFVAASGAVAVTVTGGGVVEFIGCLCLVWS
jgi:hypothetical protein